MAQHLACDVLIAGGGMAGLCASISALETGARVLTIEKGNRSGGSMRLSGGLIWTFHDKEQLHREIPDGNRPLQDLVVDELQPGLDWLAAQGVRLSENRPFMWYGRGRHVDPAMLSTVLVERLQALGGTFLLNTSLEGLLGSCERISGVRAHGSDGMLEIEVGAVVLATGGFQGNAELLARYVTPHADRMYLRANPWSTGDGLLAAQQIGAAVTPGLGFFYGHALAAPPTRFTARDFLEVTQRYGPIAVALNLEGRRFVDESAGTGEESLNQAVARQTGATAAYVVDDVIAGTSYQGAAVPRAAIARVLERGGPVVEAGSLEELCDGLAGWGFHAANALETLHGYNAAVTQADTVGLFPPRGGNRYPLATPPFSAVLVRAAITFTCGGLDVDQEMRVLHRSASSSVLPLAIAEPAELVARPIPGLYAAGCDAGYISNRGYMGGLATALVTGRIAGRAAAMQSVRPAATTSQ
ncbi:MAG TPA: FAD-dependent oxidoreductase [Dehalococcoidia bacterium]|nr:FAD-dependent oxidoreductase [Dehalococcoidia bacterium]